MKKWFTSKEAKRITIIIMILCIVLVAQVFGFLYFNKKLYSMSLEHSMQQVDELSMYVEKNLYLDLKRQIHILKMIETQIEMENDLKPEKVIEQIQQIHKVSDFRMMGISDLSGRGVNSAGEPYNISYENIAKHMENDEVHISNVLKNNNETMIFIAVPLKIRGEVRGIIWGKHALNTMVDEINFADGQYKYFQIVDDKGRYLRSSKSRFMLNENPEFMKKTVWEEMQHYSYPNGETVEEIRARVQRGEKGNFYFESEGEGRYVSYRPLKINNWYLFSVQVDDGLRDYVYHTRQISINLFVGLAVGLIVVFGAIYNLTYSMYKRISKQNGEIQAMNVMLHTTLQQTKTIPFSIDYIHKEVTFYGYPSKDMTQCRSFDEMRPMRMVERGLLDVGSLQKYEQFYKACIANKSICDPVIIYAKIMDKREWFRVSVTAVGQSPTDQTIGVLENYGEQREKDLKIMDHLHSIETIEKRSQIDFLTRVYNREAFISKIQQALLQNQDTTHTSALLILDLDHFKDVNDCMGHAMGDLVLQETAAVLSSFFRRDDVVGRLGGDEFVVFASRIQDIDAFRRRLGELNQLLYKTYSKDGKDITISASIGVMLTDPQHMTFTSLYERADKALYQVKEGSRNGYRIWTSDGG